LRQKHRFNVRWVDIETAANDDVLAPIEDADKSLFVKATDVARSDVAKPFSSSIHSASRVRTGS
jgi:hypothetical protein